MSLRDNLDELDAALYDLLTSEPWATNRAAPLVASISDPVTGGITISGLEGSLGLSLENTWVGVGDSTMNIMGGPNLPGNTNFDRASYTLANAMLGSRMKCLYNGGVSGDTTAKLLARIKAGEFEPYRGKAKFLILKIGVNDAATQTTWATTKANLDAICAYFTGFAEYFVWHTNTPYGYDASIAKAASKIAEYIRYKASITQSCILIDSYNVLVDKSSAATGGIPSGYGRSSEAPNYLHLGPGGARVEADEIYKKLSPVVVGSLPVFCNPANTVANWGADATQVLPNPLCLTNGGTLGGNVTSAGAGGLAGAPSDWTVREAGAAGITVGTCQLVARTDGRGNNIHITAAAGSVAGVPTYELLTASHHSEVSDGQVVQGEFTITTNALVNLAYISAYLSISDAKGSRNEFLLIHDSDIASLSNLTDAVFKSKEITLVAPITQLRLRLDIKGASKDFAGLIDIGAPCIRIKPAF